MLSTLIRNAPTQDRSRQRLETILESAAELFAESGFDATTMEAIAAAAGCSIGSVYRFFPDKGTLLRALAARSRERAQAKFMQLFTAEAMARPLDEIIDAVVDGLISLSASDSGLRATARNAYVYSVPADDGADLFDRLVFGTELLVKAKAPYRDAKRCHLIATMVVHVLWSTLLLDARGDEEFKREVLLETKTLLRRYLRPRPQPQS